MSPLWRDEVGIAIGPRRVILNRLKRGVRPKSVGHGHCEIAPAEGGGHDGALIALRAELTSAGWRNAAARVVIADQWVRFLHVPATPQLTTDAERLAQGRHLLSRIYGDLLDGWNIALGDPQRDGSRLLCAMPAELEQQIKAVLATAQLQLLSLQPNLFVAFNSWRHALPAERAWFVSIEDATLAALRVRDGEVDRVHCARVAGDWSAELSRLRTFGRLVADRDGATPVYIAAPLWLRSLRHASDDGLVWLQDAPSDGGTLAELCRLRELQA